MGEAKRRKKLDPNYGTGIGSKTKPKLKTYLMGDVGRKCYEEYGRGILVNMPGIAPRYALSSCSWMKSWERELIANYDPETEVVMEELSLVATSRIVEKIAITKANQLRLETNWDSIEEVVSNMFVATADNEPK
ncbi:MAG: hypothetical protein SWZ49_27955 [Cyanobacteriota bacterium]|nr:hypothetical protein [Cyanobacteriota bacterium]